MREMKDSGIAWIGVIPQDWEIVRTKSLYCSAKEIAGDRADDFERLALTLNGVIKRSKEDSVGLQPEKFSGYQILKKGELVFKLIDLENVATSRVGLSPYTGIVSPAYIVLSKQSRAKDLVVRYSMYHFLSMWQREIFNQMGDNGVRSSLNTKELLNIPHPFPSICEQKRIVTFLDAQCAEIDTVLEKTRASIEEYKKLKQAVITQAVTKGIRGDRPMKDSGIEWIGDIPAEWDVIRVKQLLKERNERSKEGKEEPLSMSQKVGLVPTKFLDSIPNMASSFVGAKLAYVDDLVFNKLKAHLGVFSVSRYDGLVSPDYAVYCSTGKSNLKYLEYIFKTPQCIGEFSKKSTGIAAGLMRLYTEGLFSIYLPYPALSEQEEIAEYLNEKCAGIDALIAKKQQYLTEIENYKKSLIYEYVTGKKEVHPL